MLGIYAKCTVLNATNRPEKYIVARLVMGELWYWGSWDTKEAAERVAEQFQNGIVIERYDDEEARS